MNTRVVFYQVVIFGVQWGLMLVGFGILTRIVAPLNLQGAGFPAGRYFDAGLKALIALGFSVIWLLIWDRQVRVFSYRRSK